MTNSKSKMTGRGIEGRNPVPFTQSTPPMVYTNRTYSDKKNRAKVQTTPNIFRNSTTNVRLSFSSSPSTSPRTSPGLISGHFAGGKWSEPPSPCDVPTPPQQWTTLLASANAPRQCYLKRTDFAMHDVAQHLKMLLKVQA